MFSKSELRKYVVTHFESRFQHFLVVNRPQGKIVDVGLVLINTGVEVTNTFSTGLDGVTLQDGCVYQGQLVSSLDADSFPPVMCDIYGVGARSDVALVTTIDPRRPDIFFRPLVSPGDSNALEFQCIHGQVFENFAAGDSGAWCLTSDGRLVGMAMASTFVGGNG